jgi:hypothetical protein
MQILSKGTNKMSFRKHGSKVFGLSITVALGLMALSASAALGTDSGVFLEDEVAITSLKTATGEVDVLGQLEIPNSNIEIDCTGFNISQGDLLGSGVGEEPGVGHVEVLSTGCKAYALSPLQEQKNCKLYETALDREKKVNAGNIVAKGLVLVFLHTDGTPYVRVHGVPNGAGLNVFAQIFSENCIGVPNGVKVTGLGVLKVTLIHTANGHFELIEMANLTLFPNELRYGENEARILGSALVTLTNAHVLGVC